MILSVEGPLSFSEQQTVRPSVSVGVGLVWSFALDTNIVGLLLRQCGELCAKSRQVKPSHLLIQLFGEEVHVVLVLLLFHILEEIKLCKRLVCERARHDK